MVFIPEVAISKFLFPHCITTEHLKPQEQLLHMLSASIMVLEEGFSPNHCNALSSNWASNHLGFVFTGRHEGGNIYFLTTNIGAILQHRCWANSPRSLLCCTGGLFKSVSEGLSHLQRSFIFWSPNLRFLSCTVWVSTQRQWMPRLYYRFEWRWFSGRHRHNMSLSSPS